MDLELPNKLQSIFPVSERDNDEQTYFKIIDEAMQSDQPRVISNGQAAHAIYLIYKFLDSATESVKIYTGSLKQHLKGNLLAYADKTVTDAAIRFLRDPDARLTIVIADELDIQEGQSLLDHPMVARIHESSVNGQFTLLHETGQVNNYPEHLLIMDDKAVRVETEPQDTKAFVSFGDRELGELANRVFEGIRRNCEQLYPVPSST